MDELWIVFCRSGKISDYLKYKNSLKGTDDGYADNN